MNDLLLLTAMQLNRAADLKEQITDLKNELAAILGSGSPAVTKRGPGRPRKAITAKAPVRKRRKMSPAARARMATAAKERWAKAKAAGKNSL